MTVVLEDDAELPSKVPPSMGVVDRVPLEHVEFKTEGLSVEILNVVQ